MRKFAYFRAPGNFRGYPKIRKFYDFRHPRFPAPGISGGTLKSGNLEISGGALKSGNLTTSGTWNFRGYPKIRKFADFRDPEISGGKYPKKRKFAAFRDPEISGGTLKPGNLQLSGTRKFPGFRV